MVRRWVKRVVIFVSVIIILLIGLVLFLHTAVGKSLVQKKLQSFLQERWNTEVVIRNVNYSLPNWIALEGVIILDAKKDTLLNAGRLFVGIRLFQLLSNKVEITSVILDDINVYCHREKNAGAFNFQFIIDSFTPATQDNISSTDTSTSSDSLASPENIAGLKRKPMHLSLKELKLGKVRLTYKDESSKLYFTAFIGQLSALPGALNPGKSEFKIRDFLLQNTDVVMVDSSDAGSINTSDNGKGGGAGYLLMALGRLRLHHVSFSYKRPFYETDYSFRVENLQLREALLDLAARDINAKSLELNGSSVNLNTWTPSKNETKKVEEKLQTREDVRKNNDIKDDITSNDIKDVKTSTDTKDVRTSNDIKWKFVVKTIDLSDNSFVYENAATPKRNGLDFQHIDAQKISLKTNNSSFDSSGLSSDIDAVSLLYNNLLNVKKVSGKVRISDSLLKVQDLTTAFNQSYLKINGDVTWPLKPAKSFANSSSFQIEDLSVDYSDLLLIKPELKKLLPVSLSLSDKIMLSGNFSGTRDGLKAERLTFSTSGRQLHFIASVDVKMEKAGPDFSAHFQQLRLKKQLLTKALLKQLQEKQNILLPDELLLTGRVQLNSQRIISDLKLNSEYGELQINGIVKNFQNVRNLNYDLTLNALGFETGKWIGLDSAIGKITGSIFVNGQGIEPGTMTATARLQLSSAVINKYSFQNINLQAALDQAHFKVLSNIQDPNLKTDIDLAGRIDPGYSVHGTIRVKNADLFKMRLTADSFQYAGNIIVNASYDQPKKIDAYLESDSNTVFINGKQISTDRVTLKCYADTDTMMMNIESPFLDAQFAGNYPVDSLVSEIAAVWEVIYPMRDKQLKKVNNQYPLRQYPTSHRTSLNVVIKPDTLLNAFLPQLRLSQPLTLQARNAYRENETGLGIQLSAPALSYGNIEVREWQLKAKQTDSIVQFSLTGDQLMFGKKKLTGSAFSGQIQRGLLTVKGQVNDSIGRKFYAAHVRVQKANNEIAIHILDDLTFNRNQWKVSPDNAIRLVEKGVIIHELKLESRGQKIVINTKEQQSSSPIDIRLDSFELRDIFTLLSPGDTLVASGIINADFSIRQPMEKIPVVTGDIKATNLVFFDTPVGDFQFHSASAGDSLLFYGGLSGANELDFNAGLHLKDNGIYLESQLKKFNLAVVQGFTKDLFAHLSGKITGNLQLAGSLDVPKYKGAIQLDSTKFSLLALNTIYRIDKQEVLIKDPDLLLQHFAITDSGGNKLNITGRLGLFSPGEKALDLAVEAKDFMLLNSVQKPDVSLYGRGTIDAKLSVKGTVEAPMIVGDAYLQKNSQIHLVSGANSKVAKTRTDGILFVDIDTIGSVKTTIADVITDTALSKKKIKGGLNYDLDLKVDKDAQFSVIIDPSNDDELSISGDARLKAGLLDNGKVGIEGVYNLQSGYYKINNLLLRGKFLLVKGSSISFSGDPSLADADVTTEYIVEASPKGLLNYKEGDDAAYNQRVPFGIILTMKGPVSKPALSFDIQLRPGKGVLKSSVKSDVEHALDRLRIDVAEMNKQVFSLLLTKRFSVTSGTNTLENTNLNANNALKEGVSSFLTEAMNQAADQLIKGVDVDVNMKTYKTDDDPVSKTDLGVAVSKGLMEDRLIIRIEENFPVGNSSTPVKSGSQYTPDITSTYKLSKDGRFQLKAYQKNEYDAVVQGYFTEIGINFTIEVSYEKFNEIMRRRKDLADEKQ